MLIAKENVLPSNGCYTNRNTIFRIIFVFYTFQAFMVYNNYDNQLQSGSRGLASVVQPRTEMYKANWGHVQYDVKKYSGNELYYCYHSNSY